MEPEDPPLTPRSRAWLLAALTLVVGAAFPYFASLMNANERPRILQAIAFVDAGELRVDGPGARGIDPGIDVARSDVDGHLYPNKPPGATVAAIAGYATSRAVSRPSSLRDVTRATRLAGGVLPTMVLVWFLLRRARSRYDVAAIVLYVVATPALSYGRLLFGPPLTACLLTIGVAWLVEGHRDGVWPRVAAGAAMAGAAVTVEYLAVFAGVPIAIYVLHRWWRDRDHRRLAAAIVGALVPIIGLAAYHTAIFGGPFATGYHNVTDPGFAEIHAHGLLGLGLPTASSIYEHVLSPWGGLVYWAPLWVVAFGVAARSWRTLSVEARLGTAIFGLLLLVDLGLAQTGGWRVGPRYLVGFFALLLPAVSRLLRLATTRASLAVAVLALAGFSVLVNLLASHLFPHLIPGGNPLADLLVPLWVDGHAPYNWLAPLLGERLALHGVMGLALGVAAWALSELDWDVAWRWKAAGLGVAGAGLLFVAALGLPAGEDAEANLAAVEGIWEPSADRPRITIQIGPLK